MHRLIEFIAKDSIYTGVGVGGIMESLRRSVLVSWTRSISLHSIFGSYSSFITSPCRRSVNTSIKKSDAQKEEEMVKQRSTDITHLTRDTTTET